MFVMKSRLRRSMLIAGAIATAAVFMAGCAGAGQERDPEDSGGELSVWFPGTVQAEIDLITEEIVPQFEEATGAKVSVTFVDWSNLSPKLNAAFAAGTAPDVFGHGSAAVADFVANGLLEPLTADVESLSEADREDIAAALPGGMVDGTQYYMPLSVGGNLVMYNADDFEAVGLDPDAPPRTWEGIRAAAEKLTVVEGEQITRSGLLLPSQPIGRSQSFTALLLAAGGKLVDESGAQATFNSQKGTEALDFFTSLYTSPAAVSAGLGTDYSNAPVAQQPLVLGTASMTLLPATTMQQIVTANPDKDLRVMQPASLGEGDPAAFGGAGPGLMISADSKQKALAWEFINFMISPEISEQYAQGIGAVPLRASALSSDYVQNSAVLQAFLEASPFFIPNPNVGGWVQVRDELDKQVEVALNGVATSSDALGAAATAADTVLQQNAE